MIMMMVMMMMTSSVQVFVFLLIASMTVQAGCVSAVQIDVTTQYHDGVIPNAFHIRCAPNMRTNCAKTIVSIQVTKDDSKIIASIQGQNTIVYNPILKASVKAEGLIHSDMNQTFLSVTVNQAVAEDSGLYTCKLLYIDESLQYKFLSASKNVTISNQDTQDIIKHLISKISFLENLVQFQQEEVSNLKAKVVDQGTELQSQEVKANVTAEKIRSLVTGLAVQKSDYSAKILHQNAEFNSKLEEQKTHCETEVHDTMSVLSSRLDTQEHGLRLINARENTTVSFTALHTRTGVFQDGKDLIYSDVIENTGGAYNSTSGVFTAVVDGYYMFHLSLAAHGGRYIEADLKTNTGKILTRVAAGEPQWGDFSDTGCVARLNAGDRVSPSIRNVNHGDPLWERNSLRSLNKFTGFLLKATGEVQSSKRARVASQLPFSG